ncbi:BQ2448_2111 [Microbotryum intermedium]|uniref:tRNA-5-taurinomethyluridine 2-sulfurtransferase n=1 Tax=Microbotryum intermedium TaxID=269621 RepID=A0A238FAI0_9BASI|nr:BQ2448_2111 [Microbotryum intermedium]
MRLTPARFKLNPTSLYPSLRPWTLPPRGSKIFVACSAGIDSSVTARLLLEKDYDIHPVFMRNWDTLDENSQTSGGCEWEKDWEQVQVLCRENLGGVKPSLVDLSKEYWNEVFERSLGEWERGVTPNPDVVCNQEIKFRALPSILFEKDPNAYLATGHYARLSPSPLDPLEPALHRGSYPLKDQSYYLSTSPISALKKTLFPLGEYRKDEVKELARKWGLPDKITERKESMGICFVGKKGKRFRHWLDAYLPPKPGNIVLSSGKVVGHHQGLWQYTIGESARLPGLPSRHFIGRKDVEKNEIVVVPEDSPILRIVKLFSKDFKWLSSHHLPKEIDSPKGFHVDAQTRSLQEGSLARSIIELKDPLIGVSPGQAIVLYDGTWCLGGGTIESTTTLADLPQSNE